MKKCAMPLSEPLVDHRPRSEMVRRSWRVPGGGCRHTPAYLRCPVYPGIEMIQPGKSFLKFDFVDNIIF